MNNRIPIRLLPLAAAAVSLFTFCRPAAAFPPAPPHLIHGMVRGELGDPLTVTNATVILETGTGVQVKTTVIPLLAEGENYRLYVPMDSGLLAEPYKPTALNPTAPFRMAVKIGNIAYLPIEMTGDFRNLGRSGGETRIDLTLGEDLDGDGLPDAWERAIIAALGGTLTLADIDGNDDSDGDGMKNLDEYYAGSYAFDPQDGFRLDIARMNGAAPVVRFTALKGRSYRIVASADLKEWQTAEFRIPGSSAPDTFTPSYASQDYRQLEVEIETQPDGEVRFFKLVVQ